jgi:NAD(P)-dependent dehydrogenase (short-subunit alcohol dehydrogenase family)
MVMSIKPKLALVTGCNRGIGFGIARHLIRDGFHVALVCRRLSDAKKTAETLGVSRCTPFELDFSADEFAMYRAASKIASWLGDRQLNVVVNNAGNSYGGWDVEAWEQSRSVNYKGPVMFTEALFPSLANGGSVTMVGSGLGDMHLLSPKFQSLIQKTRSIADLDKLANLPIERLCTEHSWVGSYGLSKALVHRASEIFAADSRFKVQGIRVNAVCPGWVATDMGGYQAPITVEEAAGHVLERALQPPQGLTGTFVCYCYKNYDDEHNLAWEKKHEPWKSTPEARMGLAKKRKYNKGCV